MSESQELKQYNGSCHCGAVEFTAKLPAVVKPLYCDCSICSRHASLWALDAQDVTFTKGEDTLKHYTFGPKKLAHCFCPTCGTLMKGQFPGAESKPGINVRTIEALDIDGLEIRKYKGSEKDPPYAQPPLLEPKHLKPEEGMEIYHGNCHCGAVRYAVKKNSLTSTPVISCNCSLCGRQGQLRAFCTKNNIELEGEDAQTSYLFAGKNVAHKFCSTCGVPTITWVLSPDVDMFGVNTRTLVGLDLDKLIINKVDGKNQAMPNVKAAQDII